MTTEFACKPMSTEMDKEGVHSIECTPSFIYFSFVSRWFAYSSVAKLLKTL